MIVLSIKSTCSHEQDDSNDHSRGHEHKKKNVVVDSLGYIFAGITHSFCEGLIISVAFVHS